MYTNSITTALDYFFLLRLSRNNIPVRNAGHAMVIDQDNARYRGAPHVFTMTMYASPASTKVIAPTNSCFRLMMSIAIRINDGIECMRNPPIWIQMLPSPPNISSQNMVRKSIKIIARILGARVRNLEWFFFSIADLDIMFNKNVKHRPNHNSLQGSCFKIF